MVFVSDPKKPVGGHILVGFLCVLFNAVFSFIILSLLDQIRHMREYTHHPSLVAHVSFIHLSCDRSATRVYLRKGRGEERVAKIYDSPDMPENECSYTISGGGIADVFV